MMHAGMHVFAACAQVPTLTHTHTLSLSVQYLYMHSTCTCTYTYASAHAYAYTCTYTYTYTYTYSQTDINTRKSSIQTCPCYINNQKTCISAYILYIHTSKHAHHITASYLYAELAKGAKHACM